MELAIRRMVAAKTVDIAADNRHSGPRMEKKVTASGTK
jgi:hypothetical protein